MRNLEVGMKNLEKMIEKWKKHPQSVDDYVQDVIKENKGELDAM